MSETQKNLRSHETSLADILSGGVLHSNGQFWKTVLNTVLTWYLYEFLLANLFTAVVSLLPIIRFVNGGPRKH